MATILRLIRENPREFILGAITGTCIGYLLGMGP